MTVLYEGPALRVSQPIGEFWVSAIPAGVLLQVGVPDPLRLLVDPDVTVARTGKPDDWTTAGRLTGNQRPIEERRLREIAQYIDTVDATFPNSIILSANGDTGEDADGVGEDWVVNGDGAAGTLVIPKNARQASIVDGQHRLYAFLRSQVQDRRDEQLVCSIFFGMPRAIQAMIFATINTNQKQVRRGLAMNLYGYNIDDEPRDRWSPEKLAVFLTRRLNFDPESALHNRIKIEAADAPVPTLLPGAVRAIPTAAVVDGLIGLMARNPKRDRSELRSGRFLSRKSRANLEPDGTPLRKWYTASSDFALYELIRATVAVIDDVIWSDPAPRKSMLKRAIGIRAIFALIGDLIAGAGASPDGKSEAKVRNFVKTCTQQVRDTVAMGGSIDFSDGFFSASGQGQSRVANIFRLASGMASVDQMPEGDRADYSRLLRGAEHD